MIRDYMLLSPSLEGVLSHESLAYEGLKRPIEVLRALDGPAAKGRTDPIAETEYVVLDQYFHDLYGVFMKKLSQFMMAADVQAEEVLKLQAMLQEMIKVKQLKGRRV